MAKTIPALYLVCQAFGFLTKMDGKSEFRNFAELKAKLTYVILPFEDIVPVAAKGCLEKVATSHGTSREMLLLSALTSTSALIGKSTLQVFSTYEEKGNHFTVVIAPSAWSW